MEDWQSAQMRPTGASGSRASERLVLALLDSATEAIFGVDPQGRIILANPRATEMFGYPQEELIGATVELLLPLSNRHGHARAREAFFARPQSRPMGLGMDLEARRKDGTEFPVEVGLSTIETENGPVVIAFASDISRRKSLEEQLLQAQKMEALGRLAGGIAHDFNNMLTVISGYNRMILDELPPNDPMREYADEIGRATDRSSSLISQLLAFSRRQLIQPRVINLDSVVARMEGMLHRLLGEDIQVALRLSAGGANITADPNQIEQAIVNLAINGRDAMPQGGEILLETGNVYLDASYPEAHLTVAAGDYVVVGMSDTGQGMTAEVRRRLFEPFFTTKEVGKGTGLGLAMVYGMVKQNGGGIEVFSEPGKGTTVKLYFPRASQVVSEHTTTPATVPKASGETVLVVEDEEQVRNLTVRMLQQLGYKVLAAASGQEAIDVSNRYAGKIGLLLADVVMPHMSGRQVADMLIPTRPDLKVLFLSGHTGTVAVRRVFSDTINFLPKPFSREMLGAKVQAILGPSAVAST